MVEKSKSSEAVKIGINGFGRIGRLVCRAAVESGKALVTVINDPNMDLDYMVYQFKYDSVHGKFSGTVTKDGNFIIINNLRISVFHEKDPSKVLWGNEGAEYVCECTGVFLTKELCQSHLLGGARKVIISGPAADDTPTYVMGVNENQYRKGISVVSNASCTTNCLAPLAKIINDAYGIVDGYMTSVHAMTAQQLTVDGPRPRTTGADWRTGRAASLNIIPSRTGASKTIGKVLPELEGKLVGMAFRIPVVDVSCIDLTLRIERNTTYEEVCDLIKKASQGHLKDIIGYTEDEVVSQDFIQDSRSAIFDSKAGNVLNKNFLKIVAWYDNEWAYSHRLLDLINHMVKTEREG